MSMPNSFTICAPDASVMNAVISFVTVGDRISERGNEIGFRGLSLLDFETGIVLSQCQRTKAILRVREVSDNLAEAADRLRRLEIVILFGHFFSGTYEDTL